jgi:TonB family protein
VPVELALPVGSAQATSTSVTSTADPAPVAVTSEAVASQVTTPTTPTAQLAATAPAITEQPAPSETIAPKPVPEPAKRIELPAGAASGDADLAPAVNVAVQTTAQLPDPPVAAPVEVSKPVVAATAVSGVALTPSAAKNPLELPVNARKALADGRLVQPDNDNASYWLEQMRTEGSDVPSLIEIETKLANAFIQRAEDDYIAGDIDAAQRWIDLAERNGANEDELTPVRSAIAKLKRDDAAASAKAQKQAKNNPKPSGQAASAGQAGDGSYQTVALSNFEFINYVEPEYPPDGTGRSLSGWVDVAFTVGKDGKTLDIQVVGSDLPDRFVAPSVAAVKRWRFEPFAPNGLAEVANSAVRLRYSN